MEMAMEQCRKDFIRARNCDVEVELRLRFVCCHWCLPLRVYTSDWLGHFQDR